VSFYKAWHSACRAACVPGRIPHDMCRSSARNMVTKRGVAQRVAQELTGRKTASIFARYHIVANADLHAGAEKLTGLLDNAAVEPEVRPGVRLAAVPGSRARKTR